MIDEGTPGTVQVYGIKPKDNKDKKIGKWDAFKDWVSSFFVKKHEQGERVVEAEVKIREAEARKRDSEAFLNMARAHKEMAEVSKINAETEILMQKTLSASDAQEKEKLEGGLILEDPEEFRKKLEEKIKMLSLIDGAQFDFENNEDDDTPTNRYAVSA